MTNFMIEKEQFCPSNTQDPDGLIPGNQAVNKKRKSVNYSVIRNKQNIE